MSSISDLKFDDKNFNKHTEYGMSLLEKSLKENGAGRSILIDKDNNIIAGNGIIEAAGQAGFEKVKIVETTGDEIIAVKRTDLKLDSKKGREMALADNATASIDLDWNDDLINEEADKWGFDASDWLGNDWKDEPEEVVEDEAPEANENEPAKSKLGEVYHLGNHRLMCGDSTDAGNVAILMDGQKADLWLTDPPYNVDIGQGGGSVMSMRKQNHRTDGATILNDHMDDSKFADFLLAAFSVAKENLKDGSAFYIWHADTEGYNFRNSCRLAGLKIRQCLIWKKDRLVMGRQDYQWIHEPCLYGWKDGDSHKWFSDRKQTTVLEYDRPTSSEEHPTMKPVALFAYQIQNSTEKGGFVLDTFGGSGTTLIACEQLGRKCYMMELDPKYCDVIRKRYWKLVNGSEEGWEEGTPAIC